MNQRYFQLPRLQRAHVMNSTSAVMATFGLQSILRLASQPLLSWLLYPEAFGIVLFLVSVQFILQLSTDMGITAYTIRSDHAEDKSVLDFLWTIEVIRGAIIGSLMFLSAAPLGQILNEPRIVAPLQVIAFTSFIAGFRSMSIPMARRKKREWVNSFLTFGAYLLQLAVTIALAFMFRSHWALVAGMVVNALTITIGSYLFYEAPWHRLQINKDIWPEVWRFTRLIWASSLLTIVIAQMDKIYVIGAVPLAVAGIYAIATNFSMAAENLVENYISRIYFANAAAHMRSGQSADTAYYEPLKLMRPFFAFVCAGGVMFGAPFIEILLDDRYLLAGSILSVLVLRPLLMTTTRPAQAFLVNAGKAVAKFWSDVIQLIWIVTMVPLGFHYFGLMGLVWAVALRDVPSLFLYYGWMARLGALRFKDEIPYLVALSAGLLIGGAAALLYQPFRHYFVGV